MPDMVGIVQGLPVVLIPQPGALGFDVGKGSFSVGPNDNGGFLKGRSGEVPGLLSQPVVPFT